MRNRLARFERGTVATLGMVAVLSFGCVAIPPAPPTKPEKVDPVLVLSFDTHLTVARFCEMVGPTSTAYSPGNLVLSFVETSSSSTNTVNGVGSTVSTAGFQGIAYRCPKEIVKSLTEDDVEETAVEVAQ